MFNFQDKVVIPLRAAGAKVALDTQESDVEDDPVLVVHPNYVIE